MNRRATMQNFDDRCIVLKKWCRKHGLLYQSAYSLLTRDSKILETKNQQLIISALIADGLYVPSDDEGVAVSTGTEG